MFFSSSKGEKDTVHPFLHSRGENGTVAGCTVTDPCNHLPEDIAALGHLGTGPPSYCLLVWDPGLLVRAQFLCWEKAVDTVEMG